MTIEEAIKHFESQAQCNYKPFSEAAQMAVTALRAQQTPAKLDRSRWRGCGWCEDRKLVRIHTEEGLGYCPVCGKPITEKAWAEMERKISDGQENS